MIARSATLSALVVLGLGAGTAMAQDSAPAPATPAPAVAPAANPAPAAAPAAAKDGGGAYESARNQLGVLIYCQDKGHIDGKAVETQTRLLAMIPVGDAALGDAAEAKGKLGTVSAMGVERSLPDAAAEQKTTEEALCHQMDTLLQQLAAQVPS